MSGWIGEEEGSVNENQDLEWVEGDGEEVGEVDRCVCD